MIKYKHTHPVLPPNLYVSHIDGKKYVVPGWQEVNPLTTLEDIEWVREKKEVPKTQVETFTFPSSSSKEIYIVKKTITMSGFVKYSCSCPGVWRSADRKCKHIKLIMQNG
jgi:hypothetical protein